MDLKVFFKENNIKIDTVDYIASDRFKDNDNKPIAWKLKVLNNKEFDILKNKHLNKRQVGASFNYNFDANGFTKELIVKCIVEPNLNDKELQDSYGVMGAYSLLEEILTVGEMSALELKINELHNYSATEKELVDDIKN